MATCSGSVRLASATSSLDGWDQNEFLPAPIGGLDFGAIGGFPGMGNQPHGPIRLQVGFEAIGSVNTGFGARHIHSKHGDVILDANYEFIEDYIWDVARNYSQIYDGDGPNRLNLVLFAHHSQQPNTNRRLNRLLIIEYRDDAGGGYWTTVTGYPVRANRKEKGRLLWERSEPAPSGPGSTSPASEPSAS